MTAVRGLTKTEVSVAFAGVTPFVPPLGAFFQKWRDRAEIQGLNILFTTVDLSHAALGQTWDKMVGGTARESIWLQSKRKHCAENRKKAPCDVKWRSSYFDNWRL